VVLQLLRGPRDFSWDGPSFAGLPCETSAGCAGGPAEGSVFLAALIGDVRGRPPCRPDFLLRKPLYLWCESNKGQDRERVKGTSGRSWKGEKRLEGGIHHAGIGRIYNIIGPLKEIGACPLTCKDKRRNLWPSFTKSVSCSKRNLGSLGC
jgi:hypothetical protein